jgi:hypothetical protein
MLTLTATGRDMLFALQADIDESILDEFENSVWRMTTHFNRRRFITNPQPNSQLASITQAIKQQQHLLLEYMWNNSLMKNQVWAGTSLEQLKQNTRAFCEVLRDLPGLTTSIHVDHRSCVTAGMLFFNPTDDAEQSTSFYTSEQGQAPMRMSSKIGNGWYTANWHKSWHEGGNTSENVRYAMKFGLHLPLASQ